MKLIKFTLAVLLLPALFAAGWFLCRVVALHAAGWERLPWLELGGFAAGFSLMVSVYFLLPRWNWLYVFGHESTHALAVILSGGKVSEFKVSGSGGHIATDKMSWLIALAPYLVPFYPLLAGAAWVAARQAWPLALSPWEPLFVSGWGATWAFHLCFTASLLKTDQPDFASQGWCFSMVVILTGNLLIVGGLLWLWLEPAEWQRGAREWWACTAQSYRFCAAQLCAAGAWLRHSGGAGR